MNRITKKLRPSQRIEQDDHLWSLTAEDSLSTSGEVPEGEGIALDFIPQPSLPSPNYDTQDIGQDPYLSPRNEVSMDFQMGDALLKSVETDELAAGSVSFDDLLDENYGLPDVSVTSDMQPDLDLEIENYLAAKTIEEDDDFIKNLCNDENAKVDVVSDSSGEETSRRSPEVLKTSACGRYNTRQRQQESTATISKPTSNVIIVKRVGQSLPSRRNNNNIVQQKASTVSQVGRALQKTRTVSPVESVQSNSSHFDEYSAETVENKSMKNAIQARINRQKKKEYVGSLEKQVFTLTKENKQLSVESTKMKKDVKSLQKELEYLRSVLANDSALAGMLSNINDFEGVRLTSSFSNERKRNSMEIDHDYGRPEKRMRPSARTASGTTGGVCLHVVGNREVSLECCSKCARMSRGEATDNDVA